MQQVSLLASSELFVLKISGLRSFTLHKYLIIYIIEGNWHFFGQDTVKIFHIYSA
jgi:hypothetical protein